MPIIFREPEWDPFRELEQLQRRMDRLFRQSYGVERAPWRVGVYPLVNISEDQDHIFVRAELPGVKPEDLEIHIKDKNLVIRGERKVAGAEKDVNFHRRERESGFFRRVVTLPGPVNPVRRGRWRGARPARARGPCGCRWPGSGSPVGRCGAGRRPAGG